MSAHAPGDPLRLLHWNVHSWIDPATGTSNTHAVIALIHEHKPDVVSLVEVDQTWRAPSNLATVATETEYTAIFIPAFEYGDDAPVGGFGNAILTRLPVLAVDQRQLTWPNTVYDGTEPSEARAVVFVDLRLQSGAVVRVGSTHLPRISAPAREQTLYRLVTLTNDFSVPWIICGDFNTPTTTWPDDVCPLSFAPSEAQPTYPATQPTESIDYAFASAEISLIAKVLPATASDHLPILVQSGFRSSNQ